jgi:hypothetical protein
MVLPKNLRARVVSFLMLLSTCAELLIGSI